MSINSENRVIKNTIALYLRMIILTVISLFTFRIVLQVLGASDYGIYNVVGGFVTMFAFVSSIMIISSQRYFAIGLAGDDWEKINKIFSVLLGIFAILTLIILIAAETVGLWFVMNRLNVNYQRMTAIIVVYETSVLIFLVGLFVSPFQALLIADENLFFYSWVAIVEGILKVVITYLLYVLRGDKLVIYSILLLVVSTLVNVFDVIYCLKKYNKLKFHFCQEWNEYRAIFSFINWNLIGAIAAVGKSQGINIIINIFFGTVINAARSVAYQINSIISSFAQNFMKAVDPQITKAYARGRSDEFLSIIYTSSKISYYLLLLISLPIMMNAEYVLKVWLGEVPNYTIIFTILALLDAQVLSITEPILTGVQSIGKIKMYQIVVGGFSFLNLPLSYIALLISKNPVLPFWVAIVVDVLITLGRLIIFKSMYPFSILLYVKNILITVFAVTVVSAAVSYRWLSHAQNFVQLIINISVSLLLMILLIYFIGLNKKERMLIKRNIPFMRKKRNDTSI